MEAKLNEIRRKGGCKQRKDGRPTRALSAYNIFVHLEKKAWAKKEADSKSKNTPSGHEGNFSRHVSAKWKKIDSALRLELEAMAKLDRERYERENEEWKLTQDQKVPVTKNAENTPLIDTPVCDLAATDESSSSNRTRLSADADADAIPMLPFQRPPKPGHNVDSNETSARPLANNEAISLNNVNQVTPFQTRPFLKAGKIRFPPRPSEAEDPFPDLCPPPFVTSAVAGSTVDPEPELIASGTKNNGVHKNPSANEKPEAMSDN